MPQLTDREQEEIAIRVASAMVRPDTNGTHDPRKPRFDGTINLGHVLTVLTMILGLVSVYLSGRISEADHESRIKAIEVSQREFKESIVKLAENQSQALRTQDKISLTLDILAAKSKEH